MIIEKKRRFLGGVEPTEIGVSQSNQFHRCSYDLDGTNEFFANETLQSLEIGNSFTIACWVRNDAIQDGDIIWSFNGSDSVANFNSITLSQDATNNQWKFEIYDDSSNNVYVKADVCNAASSWHHVVCVKDGTNDMLVYHDGLNTNISTTGSLQTTSDVNRISCFGAEAVTKNNKLSGKLYSVAIWNVALGPEEVNAIFMRGQGSVVDLKQNIDMGYGVTYRSAPNLKHWWRLGYDQSDIGKDYGYASNLIDMNEDGVLLTVDDLSQKSPLMSCMATDGLTEYLANSTNQSYGVGNSFTVAVWVTVGTWDAVLDVVFECKTDSGFGNNKNVIDIFNFNKFIFFRVGDENGNTASAFTPDTGRTVNANAYCLVGVKDGTSSLKLYINGELVGTTTASIPETTDALRHATIMSSDDNAAPIFGDAHHVAMWDKALTAAEVKAIYNSGVATVDLSKRFGDYISYGNLKHWWWCASCWGKPKGSTTGYEFGLDMIPDTWNRINMQTNSANLTHAADERNFATASHYGVCVDLDGSTEYLANTTAQLIEIENEWSVSAWGTHDTPTTGGGALIEISRSGSLADSIQITNNGGLAGDPIVVQIDGGKTYWYFSGIPLVNTWYHFVVTWDGTDLKLFRNGVERAVGVKFLDNAVTMTDSNRRVYIGYETSTNTYWPGNIAHVAVWNKALSATEIAQVYAGNTSIDLSEDHNAYVSSANLKHWWKIGEDLDDIGKDYGGASNLIDIDENSSNISYYNDIRGDYPHDGN